MTLIKSHLSRMQHEKLTAFLEAFKAEEALKDQLKAASDADAVVAIAKAAGFAISAKEVLSAQAGPVRLGLRDEELETGMTMSLSGVGVCDCTRYSCEARCQ